MAKRCENCGKGTGRGNMVSHAKNRLKRLFKPNLQKMKAYRNGILAGVKLCTSCIKRLRKDDKVGSLSLKKPVKKILKPVQVKTLDKTKKTEEKKAEKARETIKIEDIVGKKI